MCLAHRFEKGADEADQGILVMVRDSCTAGNIGARPNTVTYGATMSAWARNGREDATDRAVALLDDMEDLWKAVYGDVEPYRAAYNSDPNV